MTREQLEKVLTLAVSCLTASEEESTEAEFEFWRYLHDELGFNSDDDDEFNFWVQHDHQLGKADAADAVSLALGCVLSPRRRSVVWDGMPWTREQAIETYRDELINTSKSDLIEDMVQSMSDGELADFMVNMENSDD